MPTLQRGAIAPTAKNLGVDAPTFLPLAFGDRNKTNSKTTTISSRTAITNPHIYRKMCTKIIVMIPDDVSV